MFSRNNTEGGGSFSFIFNLFTIGILDKKIVEQLVSSRSWSIEMTLRQTKEFGSLRSDICYMGKQMCSATTTKARRIVHARIHVERNLAISQSTLPSRMKTQFENVVRLLYPL